MNEEILLLGRHRSLVSIYTPSLNTSTNNQNCAAILLNAGLTHHVGPQRLHVKLARELAQQGVSTLRVDLSGIGDSSVSPDPISAQELAVMEVRDIMDDLAERGHDSFMLFGICSGAKLALHVAAEDQRIKGMILVNQSLAADDPELAAQVSAHFYMRKSIWSPKAWLNLLTGKINYKTLFQALAGMFRRKKSGGKRKKVTLTDLLREELQPALDKGKKLLVLLSDRHAKFIDLNDNAVQQILDRESLQIEMYPEADHLFTMLDEQKTLIGEVCRWAEHLKCSHTT